jgi:hypothetical protein
MLADETVTVSSGSDGVTKQSPWGVDMSGYRDDFICMLSHDCAAVNPTHAVVNEEVAVLSNEECEHIIDKAEEYASQNGGWTTGRHTDYATTDIPLGSYSSCAYI